MDLTNTKNGTLGMTTLTRSSNLEEIFYTCEEYTAHLKNALSFSQKYEKNNLHVTDRLINSFIIYCKEGYGIIIANEEMSVIFAFNESNMTSAFGHYLSKEQNKKINSKKNRQQIQNFLSSLEKNLLKTLIESSFHILSFHFRLGLILQKTSGEYSPDVFY